LAYQGYGRGVDLARLEAATELAIGGCIPDLTVLIDTPLEVANERRAPDVRDRFESADLDFHRRVRDGYLVIADKWGERWCVIDGSLSESDVAALVDERLASLPW
jgi:dTMP kinase